MSAAKPCYQCGAPGVRNLGSNGYCGGHLTQLYSTFDARVFGLWGVGFQIGRDRPDHGAAYADLQCVACQAEWVGIPGDPCWWCKRAREITWEWQATLVLTPPDVSVNDVRYDAAMKAWATRLAVAVRAGVVLERDARRVVERVSAA